MNYIEQHSDPEILKLGIKWALYGEKKPEEDSISPGSSIRSLRWHKSNAKHLKSRIANLKEPEFKVGEIVYEIESGFECKIKTENQAKQANNGQFFKLSHYYPGQQVESFKYVRKETNAINLLGLQELYGDEIPNSRLWQEAEEPEPMFVGETKYHEPTYEPNPVYTQFQKDKDKGIILAVLNQ